MFAKPEFELFILLTFSLFLASQCYHHRTPAALIQLQRCQLRCLEEEEHGNRHQAFCLRKCHQGYANAEGLDNYGARNQQIEDPRGNQQGSKGEERPEEKEKYPYFFEGKRFQIHFRTELGEFKALERFSRRSELLNVIDNYRLAIYEAGPNAFLLPHHVDADYLLFVASGKGVISFMREKSEYFKLETGDAIRIPAGTTVFLINTDSTERLKTVMFYRPIYTPGEFQGYFGVGGRDNLTYYRIFSNEILQAAFNAPRDKLERLIGQQTPGLVRAEPEQIRALTQHAIGSSSHHGCQPKGPFNLLHQRRPFSNNYGQFFQASPSYCEQLEDLDVSISVMNIKQVTYLLPSIIVQ